MHKLMANFCFRIIFIDPSYDYKRRDNKMVSYDDYDVESVCDRILYPMDTISVKIYYSLKFFMEFHAKVSKI